MTDKRPLERDDDYDGSIVEIKKQKTTRGRSLTLVGGQENTNGQAQVRVGILPFEMTNTLSHIYISIICRDQIVHRHFLLRPCF